MEATVKDSYTVPNSCHPAPFLRCICCAGGGGGGDGREKQSGFDKRLSGVVGGRETAERKQRGRYRPKLRDPGDGRKVTDSN